MKRRGSAGMAWALLRVWGAIGLQSFGGGASTVLLIQRTFVERRAWITAEEMNRFWGLCLLTPGINLVALTVLIGRRLGGARGVAASLAGLLLPSVAITCLLTAGFKLVQHSAVVHAVLRGVIPATAGIMGLVALNMAWPIVKTARREGARALAISLALMLCATLALSALRLPVAVVLIGMAALAVFVLP